MSDDAGKQRPEPGREASDAAPGRGVLGNLPRSRPAVRSPRRADTREAAPTTDGGRTHGERSDTAGIDHANGPVAARGDSPAEALARGGLALAGGAASLGLRLAGRAATAARDAVERR